MKTFLLSVSFLCFNYFVYAQDADKLLQDAVNFERQFKEQDALAKYQQIITLEPVNVSSLVKCTELCCSIGSRQTDKIAKRNFFELAVVYANKAFATANNNADANYAKALVAGKFTDIENDNKKLVGFVREIYTYATKALSINPSHAKANYILGKWHLKMVDLAWYKKVAVKTFYGGLPEAEIDSAIAYMEKCKTLDPYFVLNYLDLAKAYIENDEPAKANIILTKLVRLPNRTADDATLKEEGKKMLGKLQ